MVKTLLEKNKKTQMPAENYSLARYMGDDSANMDNQHKPSVRSKSERLLSKQIVRVPRCHFQAVWTPKIWESPNCILLNGTWTNIPTNSAHQTYKPSTALIPPNQHIYHFTAQIGNVRANDIVLVCMFVGTLQEIAFEWFKKLLAGSIHNGSGL